MSASKKMIPSLVKPCVIALVQSNQGKLSAMAVTWFTQVGHKPELLQVAIHQSHQTHEIIMEQGWLILSFATSAMQAVFNELGSTTSHSPVVDKLEILRRHKIAVARTEAGKLWLPNARANLLCKVVVVFSTEDGYTMLSCQPTTNLGGKDGPQLYYAGKVDGVRQYLDIAR